jgi:glucose/arabinose dehydrogenase
MLKRALLSALLALLIGVPTVLLNVEPAAATVPSGFADRLVRKVDKPTALAFAPDGRMFITTKAGQLRVFKAGTPGTIRALDISDKTCSNSERGLLGVAVDPNFATNHYVYLYYTYKKHGVCTDPPDPDNPRNPVNRVSRFVVSGNTVARSSERVLINNIPSPNGNHNAGDLHFGKDGYLYVSVGDGGCDYAEPAKCGYNNDASRDRHVLLGKILRITRNGGIPSDNPYTSPGTSARCHKTGHTEPGKNCMETFARGLRNPFRMAFDPDATGTKFRINDVGAAAWEEIDNGRKGADYGWNFCEGRHDNPNRPGSVRCTAPPFTPPIHEYSHSTGCSSITGGAFVPNDIWPNSYDDAYLFADFACDKIFKLTPKAGGGFTRKLFAGLGAGPVAMSFGPYGSSKALYYATLKFPNGGEIRRIAYTG